MSEKVKVKLYRCKWFEADIDDLSRNYWCHNPDCPTRECWCDQSIEHTVCPGFEKEQGSKPYIVEYDKKVIDQIQNDFVKRVLKELNEDFDRNISECNSIIKRQVCLRDAIKKLQNWKPPCIEQTS